MPRGMRNLLKPRLSGMLTMAMARANACLFPASGNHYNVQFSLSSLELRSHIYDLVTT